MDARLRNAATQDYADSVIWPCPERSHTRSSRGARNRNGRYLLGARRNGRASGDSICGIAQTPRPRCHSFRVGRLDDSSVASPAGRTPAIFFAAQSRRVRSRPALPRPQLHELWKDSFQGELYHALWPHPRRQAELVHFGEVRLRGPLGTGSPHQASHSIRSADDDRYWHFLHADGTRPPRWRAHSRAESRTGGSEAPRRAIGSGPRRPRLRTQTRLHTQCRGTGFREPVPEHHGALQHLPRNRKLPVLPRSTQDSRTRLPHLPKTPGHYEPRG